MKDSWIVAPDLAAARLRSALMRVAMLLPASFAVTTGDICAQRTQVSLEATPIYGTLGYGWATGPDRYFGLEVGVGVPQLDRTLAPADESLQEFLHLGVFLRTRPTNPLLLDGRARIGAASLRNDCSGCLPGLFTAVSGAAFLGGRHLKVGARLTAGVVHEQGYPPGFALNLTPIAVVVTHVW